MIVDVSSYLTVLKLTIPNLLKLMVMSYLVFYKFPQFIFPQNNIRDTLDRIVFNIIYMLFSILTIVPLLIFFKIFSYITLILAFILVKAFFLYYFEKRNFFIEVKKKYHEILLKIYDSVDLITNYFKYGREYKDYKQMLYFKNFTYIVLLKNIVLFLTFTCIVYNISFINFISISNRTTDIPVFIEWVSMLHKNQLYASNLTIKSVGGYFFGTPVLIFFLQIITNIDITILISLYPILFLIFLLINIYYFVYKITRSPFAAMFALCIFGFYCYSPVAVNVTGYLAYSNEPPIVKLFNIFRIYFTMHEPYSSIQQFNLSGNPFKRINSGLAYEIVYSFYLLYIYFFIMTFVRKKNNHYLILYGITLYSIFAISGAGVLFMILPSLLILFNAIFFRKINWQLVKKGAIVIFAAGILGNLWLLSIFKYGGSLRDYGAAAPFLDFLFGTARAKQQIAFFGVEMTMFISFLYTQLIIFALMILIYPLSVLFAKRRKFVYSSVGLMVIAVLFIYVEENLGAPRLVHPLRSVEYVLLVCSVSAGMYYKFFENFLKRVLLKKYRFVSFTIIALFFLLSFFFVPSWNNSEGFYTNTEDIQYNDLAVEIYKIKKLRRPLSWTLVSFVQGYSKVLGKGFHLNVDTLIKKYSPTSRFLEIPTEYVYIFLENIPNTYEGSGEWFYRWRRDLEEQLKAWITIYSSTHDNIRIFDDKKVVTVYEIDNREYMKYLYERKQKNEH